MTLRRLVALLLAVVVAGCGGDERGAEGRASLWVTRDRGSHVLLVREVPAGLTVLQALDREADVKTRYGGRFVQAINGVEGSLSGGRDWFYFVNGIAPDRGAAEYRLRPGEVVWWDLHRWKGRPEERIVVGAFPEPFLHGYDGRRRRAVVRYTAPAHAPGARAIGRVIRAESVAPAGVRVPTGANLFLIVSGPPRFRAHIDSPGGPARFVFAGNATRLARNPKLVRFRFEGLP